MLLLIALFSFWTVERNRLWQDPVAFWKTVRPRRPGKARPFINLSVAYRERGDHAQAIAAAQTAIRLDPRFVNGFFALGSAYLEQGDLDLAIATFQDVLHRMPDYADVYNALASATCAKVCSLRRLRHCGRTCVSILTISGHWSTWRPSNHIREGIGRR